jgi:hydroxypyruvate isomerase
MARFAPNLYHLFLELPIRERFAAARDAGFDAVEWHFPYELEKNELNQLLRDNGLAFVNAVTPVDWTKDIGLTGQPGRQNEFRRSAEVALEYASLCGWVTLHPGAGQIPAGASQQECIDTMKENVAWLCKQAAGLPLMISLEGVCNRRFSGCVLQTMDDAVQVVNDLDRPKNLGVVYDTYHLRYEHKGSLIELLRKHWDLIRHIQIGNAPERFEPGVGEIDLHAIIREIDTLGWEGWIGLELDPSMDTWSSLMWTNHYGYNVKPSPHAEGGIKFKRPI